MNSSAIARPASLPWYREPWPWLLMAGPAVVIVAGFVTAFIAVTHQDGLVADDYYKQGLAINRTLDRERAAGRMGLSAQVMFSADNARVRVMLAGMAATPGTLVLRLAHSTRAGLDQRVVLARDPGGWFEGSLPGEAAAGKWTLLLEDEAAQWRLSGRWHAGLDDAVVLEAHAGEAEGSAQ